jgi:hypothetical protein
MYNRYQGYTQGYTYSSMVKVFLEALPGYLRNSCVDPIMGDRVDTYMDNAAAKTRRTIAIEKAESAANAAKAAYALEETDQTESVKRWKALLGEFFPSYG